jgi:hypothetical protein
MTTRSLRDFQQWMLAAVTEASGVTAGEVKEAILPSRQQTGGERLAVYQNAYVARLLEVLGEQFPCTLYAAGEEVFEQLALGYLRAHPPQSYTLGRLADHWPEYLDATRPADWGEFLVEVARLEQAIDRVFDGSGPENGERFVLPADASDALRLTLVPGLELHAFRYPVSAFYTAWKAGDEPGWPEAREQFVALLRREYVVRRFELTGEQFEVLQSLRDGKTIREALQFVGQPGRPPYDELAATVREWFVQWTAGGLFGCAQNGPGPGDTDGTDYACRP